MISPRVLPWILLVLCVASLESEPPRTTNAQRTAQGTAAHAADSSTASPAGRIDFDKQIAPILQSHCTPCHYEGGTMYAALPFDKPATVRLLGVKLFTRIKAEQEQALIRTYLSQAP